VHPDGHRGYRRAALNPIAWPRHSFLPDESGSLQVRDARPDDFKEASDKSMNWTPVIAVAMSLIASGVVLEAFVPASAEIIDIGAAVFAAATWIVPALRVFLARNKKRKSSLAGVGFVVHVVALAACFSALSLLSALLTFLFGRTDNWSWLAIPAIAAFWGLAIGMLVIARYRSAPGKVRNADEQA
jgi:hypothetical protein